MDDGVVAIDLEAEHAIELFVVLNRDAEHARPTYCSHWSHAETAISRIPEKSFDSRAERRSLFARSLLNRFENLLTDAKMPDWLARVRPHAAKYPLQPDAFGELLQRHRLCLLAQLGQHLERLPEAGLCHQKARAQPRRDDKFERVSWVIALRGFHKFGLEVFLTSHSQRLHDLLDWLNELARHFDERSFLLRASTSAFTSASSDTGRPVGSDGRS